ncbi:hypothetical protein [Teredinibacter turnerae]|uniref:hypothetical protein n=1 Tax=Teredinibacter turnerae TaxID=2426 RepID=UPI0003A7500C|nr:hypothetical protein [Teredinibacter turnerae]
MRRFAGSSSAVRVFLPWLLAFSLVSALFLAMTLLKRSEFHKEPELTVRKIDVALPPPPPPPPPIEVKAAASAESAIDIGAISDGPEVAFSTSPKMGLTSLQKVEKPEFDFEKMDLRDAMSFDIPTMDVKNLDSIPKAISYKSVKYPRDLVNRGIKRVDTKVEIIIDQRGKAYVKKIVDPVYPEMIPVIRDWVAGVKFSVPRKNGKPVQAIYLYTIQFIYRV